MFIVPQFVDLLLSLGLALGGSAAGAAVEHEAALHPHVPKAIVLHGAAGTVTLTYFTVPYNPEQMKGHEAGFEWHMGFAGFATEVALTAGDTEIPAGSYKLNVLRGEKGTDWSLLLEPMDVWRGRFMVGRLQRRGGERLDQAKTQLAAAEAAAKEAGIPDRIVVGLDDFTVGGKTIDAESEHMEFVAETAGFQAARRGSAEPAGGLEFGVRMHFGPLHKVARLSEVFAAAADKDGGK